MKMERPASADRGAYYAEAASWAHDVLGSVRASRRTAWIVAGAAVTVAVLEAGALMALAPLKTVVPYTITVDRQTGYLETAQGLKPGLLSQDTAVTHAFLAQYVMARETFDAADIQANYRKITGWSAGSARDQYVQAMATSNPQSPVHLYPPSAVVQTTIKSISLMDKDTALVRFETQRTDGGAPSDRRSYAAVVSFRYTGAPARMEERLINPLGFQVTAYRRDAETAAPAPAAVPQTPAEASL